MKRIVALILMMTLSLSCGVNAFASENNLTTLNLDEEIQIDNSNLEEYEKFGEFLANSLKYSESEDYDSIIKTFCTSNTNPVFKDVLDVIADNNEDDNTLYLKSSEEFNDKYELVYDIGDNRQLIITPSSIIVDTLTVSDDDWARATTKSKTGTSSKTYYSVAGNKIFSLTVECQFYYNGSKAWYKSGFDYYYTKGTLSLWQVSNWKGWKEQSGTSYKAYCSGNFHWGVEYDGNGLVIQDYYCKNTVTCSKSGTITKSATYK